MGTGVTTNVFILYLLVQRGLCVFACSRFQWFQSRAGSINQFVVGFVERNACLV